MIKDNKDSILDIILDKVKEKSEQKYDQLYLGSLICAISNNCNKMVSHLLEYNPGILNSESYTLCLAYAVGANSLTLKTLHTFQEKEQKENNLDKYYIIYLDAAIINNNTDLSIKLIKSRPDILTDENYKLYFKYAIINKNKVLLQLFTNKNEEPIKSFMNKYPDIMKNSNYIEYLNLAIDEGCTDILRYLIENKPDITKDEDYIKCLKLGIDKGKNDIVGILIEKNMDITKKENYIECLQLAVSNDDTDLAKLLIQKNPWLVYDPRYLRCVRKASDSMLEVLESVYKNQLFSFSTITKYIKSGNYYLLEQLDFKEGSINEVNSLTKDSLLITAVKAFNLEALKILLKKGIDINLKNNTSKTAKQLIDVLVENFENSTIKDKSYKEKIDILRCMSKEIETVEKSCSQKELKGEPTLQL